MQVRFDFSCGVSLDYQLNGTQTSVDWLNKLCKMSQSDLNKTELNHRHGFASYKETTEKLEELRNLAEKLGFKLLGDDHQSLNRLHVEFPKFHQQYVDPIVLNDANRLNLLIHWLEYELLDCELFNLDFNDASEWPAQKIPGSEMKYFSTDFTFGDLHLHYVHVGRPLLEMFLNDDRVSLSNQFKPQHYFNATCGLVFREAKTDKVKLKQYYDSRGGNKFFYYGYTDPMLANGYFKLGHLIGFESIEEREDLRVKLASSSVIGWKKI